MREALRHEHQNNEQQNLIRVAENSELTHELNIARKKSASLEAEITRLEANITVIPHIHFLYKYYFEQRDGLRQGSHREFGVMGDVGFLTQRNSRPAD